MRAGKRNERAKLGCQWTGSPQIVLPAPLEHALLILHRALVIEELWQAAGVALQAVLEIHNVSIELFPAEKGVGILRVGNAVPDSKLSAAESDTMSALHAFLARYPETFVLRIGDDGSDRSLIETFCKTYLEQEGSRFGALMIFRDTARILGWLWLNRRAAQGDFTSLEMTLLNALYVQFNVAVQRVCRFEKERKANAVYTRNGRDDPATLLLDERCMPVFHNRAAVSICALWRLGPDQARVPRPEFVLPEEIHDACEDLCTKWQGRSRKGRLAESQVTRTVAHASGLSANVRLLRLGRPPAVKTHFLVHLSQIGTCEADASALALLRRLTASERVVAKLVAWGLDNQQVATELCITLNTVRAHLHNIFHKLGVNCRGKLAVLLRTAVL